ncbi:WXG100 family type VII secretion target [Actinoplanes sp. NPDC051861]|uniref:WXG100 family type VII secretion target n=1 Tax=Actinoplanes sp. NPDC051861 TaxID=3155170 RepID=UPI003439D4C6
MPIAGPGVQHGSQPGVQSAARTFERDDPMANLNITYTEMSDSATRMRNNKNEIDSRLTECKSIVDNLTGSGFVTDQASGKFDEVHTEFVNAANELMENLDLLSEWLDKAVQALRDMDTQLAGSLNK